MRFFLNGKSWHVSFFSLLNMALYILRERINLQLFYVIQNFKKNHGIIALVYIMKSIRFWYVINKQWKSTHKLTRCLIFWFVDLIIKEILQITILNPQNKVNRSFMWFKNSKVIEYHYRQKYNNVMIWPIWQFHFGVLGKSRYIYFA